MRKPTRNGRTTGKVIRADRLLRAGRRRQVLAVALIVAAISALLPSTVSADEDDLDDFYYLVDRIRAIEAFSPPKDANWGTTFDEQIIALDLERRFREASTDAERYSLINLLSNARRDRHLDVDGPGGFDERAAPVRFLPDLSDPDMFAIDKVRMFVAQVGNDSSVGQVSRGDELIEVNGRTLTAHLELLVPEYRMSTLAQGLMREVGDALAEYTEWRSAYLYRDDNQVLYKLRRGDGSEYQVLVPYSYDSLDDVSWSGGYPISQPDYPGFRKVVDNIDLEFWIPTAGQNTVVIRWKDLEDVEDTVDDMMDYAEDNGYLSHNVILDATISSGGSGSPLVIRRLASEPFKTTFGNVRCSPISGQFANGRDSDIEDWIDDGCRNGAEYTSNEPFKLRYFGEGSDGIMNPSSRRFTGEIAGLFFPWGGSNLDQMAAMFVDNNVGMSFGLPTGGYSNTWEWEEDIGDYTILYSIGHTIRPNGEVLEGNPAVPLVRVPFTMHNYETYFGDLFQTALIHVEGVPQEPHGNVNCDASSDVVDALLIAQYSVGNRNVAAVCPLPNPATDLLAWAGDVNGDAATDIVDALLVAQCSTGVANVACPDLE